MDTTVRLTALVRIPFGPLRVVTVGERSALSVCNVRMRVGLKEGMSFEQ